MSGREMTNIGLEEDSLCAALLEQVKIGDDQARDTLLELYRERLRRMVASRMDRRLRSRVDASDIVQDATMEAADRLPDYLADPKMDFYVWLRWITRDRLIDIHREHLGTLKRHAGRDASLDAPCGDQSTGALADALLADLTSPSNVAEREQNREIVRQAITELDETDREILLLRHFEHLTTNQAAAVLGLSRSGASKRHVLALRQLRTMLKDRLPEYE